MPVLHRSDLPQPGQGLAVSWASPLHHVLLNAFLDTLRARHGRADPPRDSARRSTIIRTSDGADVVVPNGLLISAVALMTGYTDGTLTFVVRAWTDELSTAGALRGELLSRTLAALREARIAIHSGGARPHQPALQC